MSMSNTSKQGGIVTTPVINMPEVAIIGINKAVKQPATIFIEA